jgi:ABC-type nickel/cobalt efflux system permease component RcnA
VVTLRHVRTLPGLVGVFWCCWQRALSRMLSTRLSARRRHDLAVLLVIPVSEILANLFAVYPGHRAVRGHIGDALRAE